MGGDHDKNGFPTPLPATQDRLDSLTAALTEAQRQNKALKAGRTPETVVSVLNAVREAGLETHFVVVGTHGLERL